MCCAINKVVSTVTPLNTFEFSRTISIIFVFQLRQADYTGIVTNAAPSLIVDATTVAMTIAALLCFAGVILQVLKRDIGGEIQDGKIKAGKDV